MTVIFKPLTELATIPRRATDGSAGFDLFSTANATIWPGAMALIPTDIACAIPDGYCGLGGTGVSCPVGP